MKSPLKPLSLGVAAVLATGVMMVAEPSAPAFAATCASRSNYFDGYNI